MTLEPGVHGRVHGRRQRTKLARVELGKLNGGPHTIPGLPDHRRAAPFPFNSLILCQSGMNRSDWHHAGVGRRELAFTGHRSMTRVLPIFSIPAPLKAAAHSALLPLGLPWASGLHHGASVPAERWPWVAQVVCCLGSWHPEPWKLSSLIIKFINC